MGRIIAITNQKGGVGKTTTAVNLSACLAEKGRKTLLVDADPQCNATSGVGQGGKDLKSVYDVLIGAFPASGAIVDTGYQGLRLLPASTALASAEMDLFDVPGRETILRDALRPVSDDFDYIMIDCPPSLSLITLNALAAADSVLVPIQCEYYALEGVGQLMTTLDRVRQRLNPRLEVLGVLLTMLDGRTNLGIQVVEDVKRYFRGKVFSTIVPRNVRLSEAPSHGLPIHLYDPRCTGTEAYRALAGELIERVEEE